jgi:hypothetical protein
MAAGYVNIQRSICKNPKAQRFDIANERSENIKSN